MKKIVATKKKFKVSYAVIADCTESVKAYSFEDALRKVKSGEGKIIDLEANETYYGTCYEVSCGKESYTYNDSGELVDDSDIPF
jgi:hypothetical protein